MKRVGLWARRACRVLALLSLIGALWSPGGASAAWTSYTVGDLTRWYLDGAEKLLYNSSVGQWSHYSKYGGWYAISSTGRSNTFIGNGSWYDLGNGFTYRYLSTNDYGFFSKAGAYRFFYRYGSGQWYHSGNSLSWQPLGASGRSAAFLGSGGSAWYDLGNGFTYWYYAPSDSGYFRHAGKNRFFYRYGSGQWNHTGDTASWQTLGALGSSAAFLGSGARYDVGNGFTYRYLGSHDYGYFDKGTSYRFYYRYDSGQWYHTGVASASWQALGASGRTAAFLGSGSSWYDLGNGFTYWYLASSDSGYFRRNGTNRFYYQYGPGQWYHTGDTASWQALGASGRTAAFLGSGSSWYDLGNGFTYWYYAPSDSGYFRDSGKNRFFYRYGPGQWNHAGDIGGWQPLGGSGRTAAFLGSGAWYDVGNGFTYAYSRADGYGYFNHLGAYRFLYSYGPGQWYHTGSTLSWQVLGSSGRGTEFVGGAGWHDIGNGFSYSYDGGTSTGSWLSQMLNFTKFAYDYSGGQWYDYDRYGNRYTLGGVTTSVGEFMGDGAAHLLDATWSYLFDGTAGHWQTGGSTRFQYAYDTGTWSHYGPVGGIFALSGSGNTGQFIGDYTSGTPLVLGNGFSYWYDSATGTGHWLAAGTTPLFDYSYGDGTWWHNGPLGGAFALSASNQSAEFVGDGIAHNLGNGFSYQYLADMGYWTVGGTNRFDYDYQGGQWRHYDYAGTPTALTGINTDAQFVGDGHLVAYNGNFSYTYDPTGRGIWVLTATGAQRFGYDYTDGQWNDFITGRGWKPLGSASQTLAFIGDGTPYTLGGGFTYTYLADKGNFYFDQTHQFRQTYTSGAWEYLHDTNVWSPWSGVSIPPGTWGTGLTNAPSSAGPYYAGSIPGSAWFISNNVAYSWNGNSFQTISSAQTFTYLIGYVVGNATYFLGSGGTSGTGYDLFRWDGTTFADVTGNSNFTNMQWVGAQGAVPYFKANGGSFGGVAHTGWDLINYSAGAANRLTFGSYTTLDYVGAAGTQWFFIGNTGTWPNYRYDVYSWNGAWNNLSNALYTTAPTWLASAGDEAFFNLGGRLYSWNQTDWAIRSGATTYSSIQYFTTVGNELFFKIYGGTGTGFDLASYKALTGWQERSDWNFGQLTLYAAINNTLYFDGFGGSFGGTAHTSNDLFTWDGTDFLQRSFMSFPTLTYLTAANGSVFFSGYNGTLHTGNDVFRWDGLEWTNLSNMSASSVAYLTTILGTDVFFSINGGTIGGLSHTGYDVFRWNGGTSLANISNMGGSSLSYIATMGSDPYFLLTGGTVGGVAHANTDLYRWNGTWANVSNVGASMTYLSALGPGLFFSVTGGSTGSGFDLYRWNGSTFTDVSGNQNFTGTFALFATVGTNGYFLANDATGRHVFGWNGTTFTKMGDAPNNSVAGPYIVYNGDILFFQLTNTGGLTGWYPALLWTSYFDFLNGRI